MNATLELKEVKFEFDIKRFHVPYVLKTKCPKCGKKIERDYSDMYYLMFPRIGQVQENFWCDECDHEWSILLNLNVSLELVEDE